MHEENRPEDIEKYVAEAVAAGMPEAQARVNAEYFRIIPGAGIPNQPPGGGPG